MITFYNHLHAQHQGKVEMFRGALVPCYEVPARADHVLAELQRRKLGTVQHPNAFDDAVLERIHSRRYLQFLATAWDQWVALDPANAGTDILPSVWPTRTFRTDIEPDNFSAKMGLYSFDAGTPFTAGTWVAARAGAHCALSAAQAMLAGDRAAFALSRPPGHHAGADFFGGYCFLNNAALAAQYLRDAGMERVAVLDIDYHHGNGTQACFYDRPDVFFASIHGDPRTEYPFFLGHADETGVGAGKGFNLNLPLPRGTGYPAWAAALDTALARIQQFGAQALVVSMGMDTFVGDPISGFTLHSDDYLRVGARLRACGLPTVLVFEGGYAVQEVGVNAVNVLQAFADV
ncbi:histone deacetylase family protein [Candidatus Aalborgicola defluviihabitans]|uniref:histone deacetylase family protein n=1 Tax=Candidatus Aalborgicola defluviihabitans TaxID=3386187 RepID=UPI001EC29516|nr:histone deacetylase family protein [Burkholderiales bacterium]MBK7280925.1 histone deacetylase family protein [Burkholderiales bacterium]